MDGLVILAGGISSRMKNPVTPGEVDLVELFRQADERPKGMIQLGAEGRPLIDYQLYNARSVGIRDVVIVVNRDDALTPGYYGGKKQGNRWNGLDISFAVQDIPPGAAKPPGTADALLQALRSRPDWSGRFCIVCNSDNLYSTEALSALFRLEGGGMIAYDPDGLRLPEERIGQFGVIEVNSNGCLREIIEKPGAEYIRDRRAGRGDVGISMNIWRLAYDLVLPFLETCPVHPTRREKELPAAIREMIRTDPTAIHVIPMKEYVPDLTRKEDISVVREFLEKHFSALNW